MKKISPAFFALLLSLLSLHNPLFAQVDTLRICTYNVLKFSESSGATRLQNMRLVIEQIDPDILVVQEMITAAGATILLDSVFNYRQPGAFSSGPFVDGPDTDNAIFYRNSTVQLLTNRQIPTSLRDISEYVLQANNVSFRIYSVHLKASRGAANETRRADEATVLRNYLNDLDAQTHFVVLGDFNIYSSAEQAFVKLTGSELDDDGRLFDPIAQPGSWHNNRSFSAIHTQSARTAQFGGGATGGLDDRFDMILVSESLFSTSACSIASSMRVLSDKYTAFGNDGLHFNESVNNGGNASVDVVIANALHEVSDHLPVYSDFVIDAGIVSTVDEGRAVPEAFVLQQNYPNPFNPATVIRFQLPVFSEVTLSLYNLRGQLVRRLVAGEMPAGEHSVVWDGSNDAGARVASGVYVYVMKTATFTAARKLLLMK